MVKLMKTSKPLALLILLASLLLSLTSPVSAQTYRFTLPVYEVEAYIEADGTLTVRYYMEFLNDAGADPIDFIDLGLPDGEYNLANMVATVNDKPIPGISPSSFVAGAAELALGNLAIQPGEQGIVIATLPGITGVLYEYDQGDREDYVNFQFQPSTFGSEFDKSTNTEYAMTIILPPAVTTTEGVYYTPLGWPGNDEPEASTTLDGNRVYYYWYTDDADVHSFYEFGAAFPASTVPAEMINTNGGPVIGGPTSSTDDGSSSWYNIITSLHCVGGIFVIIIGMILVTRKSKKTATQRKLQYMPPKISIEGQGIKRGLSAVEAGVLLEEPLDKILTMILFGLLKKEAITVTSRDPIEIAATEPLPEGLYTYETGFIEAFKQTNKASRRKKLQSTIIDLVKEVGDKMKGFSKAETSAYYKDIINRAWSAVESADTPEIKSAQYDHTLEWTMLDGQFDDRTRRTFTDSPVYVPVWWPRYDPMYRPAMGGASAGTSVSEPSAGVGGGLASPAPSGSSSPSLNLPSIPGAQFATSVLAGTSTMASDVIGDLTGFTSGVTNRTNPIPISTSSSRSGGGGFRGGGGGGHSCACACACAGCACACAGGGR